MIGWIAVLVACYLMLGLAIGAWLVDRVGLAAQVVDNRDALALMLTVLFSTVAWPLMLVFVAVGVVRKFLRGGGRSSYVSRKESEENPCNKK